MIKECTSSVVAAADTGREKKGRMKEVEKKG
jgi:hypothetical protein